VGGDEQDAFAVEATFIVQSVPADAQDSAISNVERSGMEEENAHDPEALPIVQASVPEPTATEQAFDSDADAASLAAGDLHTPHPALEQAAPDESKPASASEAIDFKAPATLRKWPSLRNEPLTASRHPSPYLLVDSNLGECIAQFMAKPESQRHLYEIHTSPQLPLVPAVVAAERIVELGRIRDSRGSC
jgi:hypothetical protein